MPLECEAVVAQRSGAVVSRWMLPVVWLLCAVLAVACGRARGAEEGGARRGRPPPLVTTTRLVPRAVQVEAGGPIDLRANTAVEVGSRVLGYLDRLEVDRGDRVRRGQLLATVRPSDLPDQLAATRGALEQNRAQLELARSTLQRVEALAAPGVTSQQELIAARAAVAAAEAQRATLLAQSSSVATRLRETRIVSPLDGVVSQRRVDVGALVGPTTGGIVRVEAVDTLRAEVALNEAEAGAVRVGMTARLRLDALPGQTFEGRVVRLAPGYDPSTRTLDAEVLLPNPAGVLRPGMYGRASIVTAERPSALVVPIGALRLRGDARYVFVVQGGRAMRRNVTTGVDGGDWMEVRTGLAAGDEVVTAGLEALADAMPVRTAREVDVFAGPGDAGVATDGAARLGTGR